jgi:hypothetical protein
MRHFSTLMQSRDWRFAQHGGLAPPFAVPQKTSGGKLPHSTWFEILGSAERAVR